MFSVVFFCFFFCFPFSGSEQTCIDLHLLYTLNVWKEKKYFAVHVCVRACIGVCQWMSVASAFECSFFLSYFYDVSAWAKINLRLSSYTPQCSLLAPTVRLSPAFFSFFLYLSLSSQRARVRGQPTHYGTKYFSLRAAHCEFYRKCAFVRFI